MGSTGENLHRAANGTSPQAYIPSTDAYKPVSGRQLGSSEYALQTLVRGLTPFAFESITATTASQTLNSTTYGSAIYASVEVQTAAIRYRVDGTAPSTSVGHIADDGDVIVLESSGEIANWRFINNSTASPTVVVTYST